MEEKTISVTLTSTELSHLINDVTAYIWKIKEETFGDKWNYGSDITEVEHLEPEQEEWLRTRGYYTRKALLDKLKNIENTSSKDCQAFCQTLCQGLDEIFGDNNEH